MKYVAFSSITSSSIRHVVIMIHIDIHSNLRSIIENRSIPSGFSTCSYLSELSMSYSKSLYIPYYECNSESLTIFDMSAFKNIKHISIAGYNFQYTKRFLLHDLYKLQHITIGFSSFTQAMNGFGKDESKSFHILNCESLESIEIGQFSFSDFAGDFELKNLQQLQSIQIGITWSDSYNFYYSSFVIQGIDMT